MVRRCRIFGDFLRPVLSASRVYSTFQTCVLKSHQGHTMCGTMVGLQSPTAEIRRGKKGRRRRNHRAKI